MRSMVRATTHIDTAHLSRSIEYAKTFAYAYAVFCYLSLAWWLAFYFADPVVEEGDNQQYFNQVK